MDHSWIQLTCVHVGKQRRFHCSKCFNTWGSARVPILFHMTLDKWQSWGYVKVCFFKQCCRHCEDAELEEPEFFTENIRVVVDKLVTQIRKRCYGEKVNDSRSSCIMDEQPEGPHESVHCEACQQGLCSRQYVKHKGTGEVLDLQDQSAGEPLPTLHNRATLAAR
nr:PREDICTED: receptor-transporting protein 2-like [Latimeria chalumnae]|eukprot:XP_014348229.1 PREDICTED: receptor-transporting protein 2-like [Latimeria chalumnae]